MFMEARRLAQYHVAPELETDNHFLTMHSDSATKLGHSFTTYNIKKSEKIYVVGLREHPAADA